MVAHRKNVPAPTAYVPSSWFIVLTVLLVIGAGGWLGWLILDDDPAPAEIASPSAPAATKAPQSPAPTADDPTPAPTADDATPAPESSAGADKPATQRTATVSVLNNSGIGGAARVFSAKVATAGWTLGGIGNWSGSIPTNTIYYPPGLQPQAELLAADVNIERVRPSIAPMRTDRLTIILSGTQ